MAYYGRRDQSSIFEAFTLSPLPYPVLFILLVVLILLGVSWSFNYEDFIENTEERMSWMLLAAPVVLLIVIRWLSSVQRPFDGVPGFNPYDRRRRSYFGGSQEGSSPWGVAAVVVLLLVLVSFQSTFQDMWRP